MKALLLILLLPICTMAQTQGHLVVSQPMQNFGKISLFDVLSKPIDVGGKYWCKNTGKVPIIITACQTNDGGCYCNRWPKEPILPGDSNMVSLILDISVARTWDKSGTIIYTEDGTQYASRIYLKGEIYRDTAQGPKIRYDSYQLSYSGDTELLPNAVKYSIQFTNTGNYPFKMKGWGHLKYNYDNRDDGILVVPEDTIYPNKTGTIYLITQNGKRPSGTIEITMDTAIKSYTTSSFIYVERDNKLTFRHSRYE